MMESASSAGVYCTLLLSDHYLPGAVVLAHSLRDNGTKAKLVALFTPDTLCAATVTELRSVYDELIPVHSFVNGTPANLWLMDRPDLIATFTKIELWRLTQYERIVYIDCDVIAIRAPDELFALDVDFAAAPDVGWPDCFNSGVMVLRPNLQDYYALKALAERGISFDGADQGLLNMHFRDWHRLSFSYNCTPSANYQYIPAYKHFQSTISLIHFIGAQKPWNLPRQVVPLESPYNQLLGKWWAIYDRHYQPPFVSIKSHEPVSAPRSTQENPPAFDEIPSVSSHPLRTSQLADYSGTVYHPEEEPASSHHEVHHDDEVPALVSVETQTQQHTPWKQEPEHRPESQDTHHHAVPVVHVPVPVLSAVPQYVRGEEHVSTYIPPLAYAPMPISHMPQHHREGQPEAQNDRDHHDHHDHHHHPPALDTQIHIQQPQPQHVALPPPVVEEYHRPPSPEPEVPTFEAPKAEWDASREPPPINSKPEASTLEQKTYTMSQDTTLFQPPPSYPEAPKNMYYQVPATAPEPKKVTQVFPWESRAPKPTRVFADEQPVPAPEPCPPTEETPTPKPTDDFKPSPEIPQRRESFEPSSDSWESYTRSNAWDDDPHIQRYIESIQQARRARTQVISGSSHHQSSSTSSASTNASSSTTVTGQFPGGHRPSIKLTDFPSEVERPSLPVTPAPIRRRTGVPGADDDYPTAEGVPSQEDWNPQAQLEDLRRRQSAILVDPARLQSRLSDVDAGLSEPSSSSSTGPAHGSAG